MSVEVDGVAVADGVVGIVVVGGIDGEVEMDDAVASGGGVEAVGVVARLIDGAVVEGIAGVAAAESADGGVEGGHDGEVKPIEAVASMNGEVMFFVVS